MHNLIFSLCYNGSVLSVYSNLTYLIWRESCWPIFIKNDFFFFFFLTMVTVCDCVAFLLNQNCWFLWETKSKKLVFCNTSVIIYYTAGLLLWRLVVRKHNYYYYKRRVRSTWPAIGHQHFCFISHGASTWCWWLGVI